jgi:hypothetical protein
MYMPNDDSNSIEYPTVNTCLLGKSLKGVSVTFDLEAVHTAVDDRDVDPGHAVPEAQLIQYERVRIAMVLVKHLRMQSFADVDVAQLCAHSHPIKLLYVERQHVVTPSRHASVVFG